ncbi:hypothetical protein [Nocardia pseudovaccinii]|uniref:hypothetical protein n=1 Tax=Nocardia pseudovaccinii TaxID=189540 RepID=UPI0007A54CB8|nr:hypothetical protein [Nocardia pseudovaccinii]
MKFRKITATAGLATTVLCITTGMVHAEPKAAPDTVSYTANPSERNTVIKTDAGSLAVEDGVFKIKAANGTTLAGTELKFRVDDFEFPIDARIDARTATLTPQFDLEHAAYKPVALPYENQAPWKTDYDREQAAWSRLVTTIQMGAAIGTTVGGIGGAALGCILGGAAGATLTGALTLMFGALPGAAVGCIAGMAAIGFLGTIAGQLFVTAPVAILAGVQYFTTINQPMPNQQPAK